MTDLHRILGLAALALALALLGTTLLASFVRLRPVVRAWAVDGVALVVEAACILAALVGPLLLATGYRPADLLHLLYAVVAVLALPVTLGIAMSRGATGQRRDRWLALGAVVVVGVAFRLVATG